MNLHEKINTYTHIDKFLLQYLNESYQTARNTENDLDKDEILSRTDIVKVISSRIELNRFHKAKCPFHDDSNASFSVHPQKQIFKCFGCNKHGNAIDFLMEFLHIGFIDALKILNGE